MAGMLPGVECARRRRFHQGGWIYPQNGLFGHGGTRRSSFCLYTSNHEIFHLNSSSSLPRKALNRGFQVDKLEGAAKEAKDRLDERLRTQRKSQSRRHSSKGTMNSKDGGAGLCSTIIGLQTEVFGLKRSNLKRFSWARFRWKASEQDECAVCLDGFKAGETLVHLPCAHRFHSRCLVPWLESSVHCPCCRTEILS